MQFWSGLPLTRVWSGAILMQIWKAEQFSSTWCLIVWLSIHLPLYSKTCLRRPLKIRPKIGFQDRLLLKCRSKVLQNAPREHSAILSALIKLPFVFKSFVLSIFEWLLRTGFEWAVKALVRLWKADLSKPSLFAYFISWSIDWGCWLCLVITLCILMDSSFWFDTINLGWSIVHI